MSNTRSPTMRQLSTFVYAVVGLAVIVVGWGVWKSLPSNSAAPLEDETTSAFVSGLAPDFSLTVFDTGETITLSGLRGQPVILDFFASWCPSCRAEAPGLQEFWQAYEGRGLTLLGVALNDSVEGLRDFKDEFLLTYPMGLDETGAIAASYRVGGIPTFIIIDREGRIANIVVGGMSNNDAMTVEAEALLK